jgi:DNA-binding NtrC family response regulator
MDGLDLARWAHRHRPDLKVILTSGVFGTLDPADERFHQGPLLQKPFKPEELEQRLRSALGNQPTGR